MDELIIVFTSLIGLLIRLGIPLGVTIGLVLILKRLDERWQAQSGMQPVSEMVPNPGCWKIMGCPEENRSRCKANAHPEMPCWQVFRSERGLQERCLRCKVFNFAAPPVRV